MLTTSYAQIMIDDLELAQLRQKEQADGGADTEQAVDKVKEEKVDTAPDFLDARHVEEMEELSGVFMSHTEWVVCANTFACRPLSALPYARPHLNVTSTVDERRRPSESRRGLQVTSTVCERGSVRAGPKRRCSAAQSCALSDCLDDKTVL